MKYLFFLFIATQVFAQDIYSFGYKAHVYNAENPRQDQPIVVMLHGCKLTQEAFVDLTGIKKQIGNYAFTILAPEQNVMMNYDHCWNWFFPTNQMTGLVNEPFIIKSFVDYLKAQKAYTNSKVYLVGFSSGGAMAMNVAYLYPEVFEGVMVHSGLAFKVAKNVDEANLVLLSGPQESMSDLIVDGYFSMPHPKELSHIKKWIFIQGKEDPRVIFKHKSIITEQLFGMFDMTDDQRVNDSIDLIKKVSEFNPDRSYPYQIERTLVNGSTTILDYSVDVLKHAWSGGIDHPLADIHGPNITSIMMDEFIGSKKK